jgi:hypothetical protein
LAAALSYNGIFTDSFFKDEFSLAMHPVVKSDFIFLGKQGVTEASHSKCKSPGRRRSGGPPTDP